MITLTKTRASQADKAHASALHGSSHAPVSRQPLVLHVAWILLLLLGGCFVFASISDLAADLRTGLPSDHGAAFQMLAGMTWSHAQQMAPTLTRYITVLEIAYAVHELVFGLLFLLILLIPFRRRARWAWWASLIPMLANLTYTFTIAHASPTTLAYSLIADVAFPVLLLLHVPVFFGAAARRSASA